MGRKRCREKRALSLARVTKKASARAIKFKRLEIHVAAIHHARRAC